MKTRLLLLIAFLMLTFAGKAQTCAREKIRLDEGWKFAFGNAADPQKDFSCGTEYFNYLIRLSLMIKTGRRFACLTTG